MLCRNLEQHVNVLEVFTASHCSVSYYSTCIRVSETTMLQSQYQTYQWNYKHIMHQHYVQMCVFWWLLLSFEVSFLVTTFMP